MSGRVGARWGVGSVAGAATLLGAVLLVPGTAAAAPPAGCVQPDAGGLVTCTYSTTGSHTLTIPAGVESVQVTAVGGRGGNVAAFGQVSSGGSGAVVTGTVAVPAGSRTVYAVVGGNGASTQFGQKAGGTGGAGGGGNGGIVNPSENDIPGAGGGGASDVRTGTDERGSRVVVAAGGGGGGWDGAGGNAGEPAADIDGPGGQPAQAGTATSGGAGGTVTNFPPDKAGFAGSLGFGGAGGPQSPGANLGGGGGGGGLYGGGGGAISRGGGGGSSLAPADGTIGLSTEAASVTITYQPTTPPNPPCAGLICIDPGTFGSS